VSQRVCYPTLVSLWRVFAEIKVGCILVKDGNQNSLIRKEGKGLISKEDKLEEQGREEKSSRAKKKKS